MIFPTGKPHISFSELFAWKECPYRHKLLHIDKLGSFDPSPYLGFGTGVHATCEHYIETREIDKELALPVTSQQSQQPIKHAAIIKFDKNSFNLDNDITKSLSLVTSAFSGSIEQLSKDTTITPLITSSNNSNLEDRNTFRYLPDPQVLISNFKSSNKKTLEGCRIQLGESCKSKKHRR